MVTTKKLTRCPWPGNDPMYQRYHDREWGVPVYNDRKLFEFLVLEGSQAGLSWITILRKRPAYRAAFDNFDFHKIARYKENKVKYLLLDAGIVRNELKIRSAVQNARAFLEVRREYGTFSRYMWGFTGGKPLHNRWKQLSEIPANTSLSDVLSKDLKQRGFKFVGSTICYAHMQAVGMVNDHLVSCFRYRQLTGS
ncbi:MAG: DNA-3-methyladenine glycosylase I [Gammaproteobacteria bacterium]